MRHRLDDAYELPQLDPSWKRDIALPAKLPMVDLKPCDGKRKNFQLAFFTRMMFSCLVDADFLDTERFYLKTESRPDHRSAGKPAPSLQALREQLDHFLAGLPTGATSTPSAQTSCSMCVRRRNWRRGCFP
ncbi:hypothetical protein ACHFCA_23465 [Delftia tsuruhatensis]